MISALFPALGNRRHAYCFTIESFWNERRLINFVAQHVDSFFFSSLIVSHSSAKSWRGRASQRWSTAVVDASRVNVSAHACIDQSLLINCVSGVWGQVMSHRYIVFEQCYIYLYFLCAESLPSSLYGQVKTFFSQVSNSKYIKKLLVWTTLDHKRYLKRVFTTSCEPVTIIKVQNLPSSQEEQMYWDSSGLSNVLDVHWPYYGQGAPNSENIRQTLLRCTNLDTCIHMLNSMESSKKTWPFKRLTKSHEVELENVCSKVRKFRQPESPRSQTEFQQNKWDFSFSMPIQ
jgi:hypothetical protein